MRGVIHQGAGLIGGMMPTFEEYLKFEQSKKDFFNNLYRSLGFDIVSRKDCKEYDVILRKDKYKFKIEEKARRGYWDDILVETCQDTETNKQGWIYYCKADFLVYGMFSDKPIVYRLPFKQFQSWFFEHIDELKGNNSKDGWGKTEFKLAPISSIGHLIKRLC